MASFAYTAKKNPTETLSGVIDAPTLNEALRKISAMGLAPVEAHPFAATERVAVAFLPGHRAVSFARHKVSPRLICELIRQLYDLVDAGITIIGAIELMERGTAHPLLKATLGGMRQRLHAGESLSSAMGAYPEIFPAVFIPMVRSGEASGRLAEVLGSMQVLAEKDLDLRAKVTGSLIYPLMVLGVGILTVAVMLTVVMPKLTALFEDFDTALPPATELVMGMSRFMASFWWLVAGVLAGLWWALQQYWATSSGRAALDGLVLKVPVLKEFIRRAETARVARALATLIEGGVPLALALGTCLEMVSNVVLKEDLADVVREVKAGTSLAGALKHKPQLWPEAAVSMVAVGEETGRLEKGLYKMAASLERDMEGTAGVFVTVLGPLVLLVVVGVVGAMIVSMLLPLFQMNMMVK